MTLTRRLILIGALMLSGACAPESARSAAPDDSSQAASASGPTAEGPEEESDPGTYCAITRRLESAGEGAFSGLGRDAAAVDYKAAERAFVEDNASLLHDLLDAAPDELAAHVDTMLTAMRQRAGLSADIVTRREASNAERRVLAWERQHC